VAVCHLRRAASAPLVYTLMYDNDVEWLRVSMPYLPSPPPLTTIPAFLATCFATSAAVKGHIRCAAVGRPSLRLCL
jgi:hypothetical protein